MITRFFVTGTGSRVGKTIVSRALLQAAAGKGKTAIGYKPIATGCGALAEGDKSKDAVILQNSSSISYPLRSITPFALISEDIYANETPENIFDVMTEGLNFMGQEADVVMIEGGDGWRTLITPQCYYSDWVKQLNIPVILVVGIQEGCVSHALLTAQAILADKLPLAGWVANRINPGLANYSKTISILRANLNAPLLGEIPYLSRAETRDMTKFIDLSTLEERVYV